jgi:biopolymer transport protein ExbD
MSIRFQCSSCGAIHGVNERALGRRIRCPQCHELGQVTPYEEKAGDRALGDDEVVELEVIEPDVSSGELDELIVLPPGELKPITRHYLTPPPIAVVPRPAASPQGPSGNSAAGSDEPPFEPAANMASAGAVRKRKPLLRKRPLQEAEMDMTPMVDVTFQLLIFFMLTASFAMQKSLNVPKPQTSTTAGGSRTLEDFEQNPDYVVVRVDAFNTFHVSSNLWEDEIEAPSQQELLVKLRQARKGDAAGHAPRYLLVVASGEALHERVVMAIDAGNEVGMDEVQLVTTEEEQ